MLAVVLGVVGCATTGSPVTAGPAPALAPAPATAQPKPPDKKELTVIGRGAPGKPPGEISIDPAKQGTDFHIVGGRAAVRCTKTDSRDPDDREYCRNLNNGDSRDPDPGRLERSKTQSGWH